ncbi:MAG: hypothetical protein COA32_04040 [Fluviicola sp.]|nr:MAG: hypothetical protein COA32_04040 [Fluviicola sp.]
MARYLNQNIESYLFAILCLIIPIIPKLVPLIIIILSLTIIVKAIINRKTSPTNKLSFRPQDLFVVLFIIYLIGMTYSSNQHFGWKDIEAKLSFILFPILFALIRYKNLKINIQFVLLFFVLGCFTSTLLNIYEGLSCYINTNKASCFISSSFTYNLHVNHISIYYGAAILSLIYLRIPKLVKTILVLWFLLFIVAFLSLGAYIALFVGFIFFVVVERKRIKHFSKKLFALVVLSSIIGVVFYSEVSSNYDQMYKDINSKEELYSRANTYSESLLTRLVIWDVASTELIKHPFGVGTGDVKDQLIAHYKEVGLTKMERQKLNPHNQYLQTGVSIGFLGLFTLLSIFIFTIKKSLRESNPVLIVFAIVITVNMLFESFLEIQAGIVFTVLFLYLLDLFGIQNKRYEVDD